MRAADIERRLGELRDRFAGPVLGWVRTILLLVVGIWLTRKFASLLDPFYPLKDWLFWRVARMWLAGAALSLSCVSFGHLILTRVLRVTDTPVLATLVLCQAVGLVGFVVGMYIGGFAGWLTLPFAVLLPTAMFLSGLLPLVRFASASHARWKTRRQARNGVHSLMVALTGIFGIVCLVFVYLEAFTPDAINFDATWCHLTVAQDYARHHRIVPFVADYARNHPHLASIVHTWGWILPWPSETDRWMFALHTEFFTFLWTLAGVGACIAWMLDRPRIRSAWVAFFLFPAIFVYDSNLGGAADHFLAFFAPPLLLATGRAARSIAPRECALLGIFGAGALLTKYQASYLLAPIALVIGVRWLSLGILHGFGPLRRFALARGWQSWDFRNFLRGPAAAILTFAVLVSPHFLRNWAFYKNPVYPFMQGVFTHSTPTVKDAPFLVEYLFKDYHWQPTGTLKDKLKDAFLLTFRFSFQPHYSFTKKIPTFGSLFTLCLPFIVLLRRTGRIWLGALVAWGAVMIWALTFRVDRNLQGMAPALAAVTGAILVLAWEHGWAARIAIVPLVVLQVIWGGDALFYSSSQRLRGAIDMIKGGYDGKREQRFEFRKGFLQISKTLPKNSTVVLHTSRVSLGINHDVLLDWAGQQGLFSYEGLEGPRDVFQMYKNAGATHLLYQRGRRSAATKQEDVLFSDFLRFGGKDVQSIGGYEVMRLPPEPPATKGPYEVLCLGLWGYKDGLYDVRQLNVYESMPREVIKFPKPRLAWSKDEAAAADLFHQAEAVLVASKKKNMPGDTTKLLEDEFDVAARFKTYVVHLKHRAGQPASAIDPRRKGASEPDKPEPGKEDEDPDSDSRPVDSKQDEERDNL